MEPICTSTMRGQENDAYPLQVCVAHAGTPPRHATVDGVPVPALADQLRRIVVIGDTGCRLKGTFVQACNDPVKWPFATVARLAAARHPDLVIHVGDYHYRETPCPAGDAGCAGSPYGDNWAVWQRDFFIPAAPLLAAAPWVLVRGNHEAVQPRRTWLVPPARSASRCGGLHRHDRAICAAHRRHEPVDVRRRRRRR